MGVGEMADKMRAALDKLKEAQRAGMKKGVDAAIAELKNLGPRAGSVASAAVESIKTLISERADFLATAFSRFTDRAFRVFDRRTEELIAKARARVSAFGFEIGPGEETPGERELREFDERMEQEARAREKAEAMAITDPKERAARLQEIARAEQRAALVQRAQDERAAADKALEEERARITEERGLERERLQDRLTNLHELLLAGKLSAEEARQQIQNLMLEYGIALEDSALLGLAFATSYREALDLTLQKLRELIAAQEYYNALVGGPKAPPYTGPVGGTPGGTPFDYTGPVGGTPGGTPWDPGGALFGIAEELKEQTKVLNEEKRLLVSIGQGSNVAARAALR